MIEFIKKLFSTDFMPHGHCYFWRPEILWLHVISDALIALAYMSIPIALFVYIKSRQDADKFRQVFLLFGAFILLCGFTHIMEIYVAWFPAYGLSGLLKAATAIVSIATAIATWRLIPDALAIPSPISLQKINRMLKDEIEERSRAEEQFKQTFEFAPNGMALVGLNGEWLRVNKAICDIVGYSREELLAITFQDITHPDDLNLDLQLLEQLVSGEIDNYQMEKRYLRKDGEIVWVLLGVSMVKDRDGEPMHFVSQINDISRAKHAEKEAKELLTVTQQQNKRLLSFAHIVSHNLRSHASNFEMVLDFLSEDKEHIDFMIESLKKNASSLSETILHLDDVVNIYIDADSLQVDVPIHQAMERAMNALSGDIDQSQAEVRHNIPEGLMIKGKVAYFDSLFINMISNALKYKSPTRTPIIQIDYQEKEEHICLSFSDNGLGIDLNRFGHKLFGMYKTFHGNKDARGIGLFICRSQVEAMGGEITASSVVGEGTTFYVRFPK